eukprot:2347139-Rhodomonas_salina.2
MLQSAVVRNYLLHSVIGIFLLDPADVRRGGCGLVTLEHLDLVRAEMQVRREVGEGDRVGDAAEGADPLESLRCLEHHVALQLPVPQQRAHLPEPRTPRPHARVTIGPSRCSPCHGYVMLQCFRLQQLAKPSRAWARQCSGGRTQRMWGGTDLALAEREDLAGALDIPEDRHFVVLVQHPVEPPQPAPVCAPHLPPTPGQQHLPDAPRSLPTVTTLSWLSSQRFDPRVSLGMKRTYHQEACSRL